MSVLSWILIAIGLLILGVLFAIVAGRVRRKCPTAINITFAITESNRCDGTFKGMMRVAATYPAPPPAGATSTVEVKIANQRANNISASPGTNTLTFTKTDTKSYVVEGRLVDPCADGIVVVEASGMCGNRSINLASITTPAPTPVPTKNLKIIHPTPTGHSTIRPDFEVTYEVQPCPAPGGGAVTTKATPVNNITITSVFPDPVPAGAGATVVTIKGRRNDLTAAGEFKTEAVVGGNTCLVGFTQID